MDTPKKLYHVSVQVEAEIVVLAYDENDARRVASSNIPEYIHDAETDIHVREEMKSLAGLPNGWTATCSPYAYYSRDQKPLSELLPEAPEPPPEVDERTIDMFTGKALVDA
jgi:hypothetical protein